MKHKNHTLLKASLFSLMLLTAACSAQNINKDADNEAQGDKIHLTRTFQRVIRYNCAGTVTSDKIETVGSPVQLIEIEPEVFHALESASFVNLTNDSYPKCTTSIYKFNVDFSHGHCNMHVEAGGNQIRYTFNYCPEYKLVTNPETGEVTKVCAKPLVKGEEGTTWIQVSYEEVTRPGFSEVRPAPESCPPPQP